MPNPRWAIHNQSAIANSAIRKKSAIRNPQSALSYASTSPAMATDPPKYRPLERFWPYAELPEQPTDAELASLDPDLHEALFGQRPRPFSITLVFPALDVPAFSTAIDLARASAEFGETGTGTHRRYRARF